MRLDAAQHEVDLQTYIFANDATGRMIAEALSRAAQRGVRVRVLVDGFGSYGLSPELVQGMRDAGVDWLVFRPELGWLTLRRHRLRRLHRKVVLIDAKVAFIGGINIIDDMDTPGRDSAPV
jgi:Phosphatidylserine/phosphatidylglycerophosphate/cardiolipin synthases and related enzymes